MITLQTNSISRKPSFLPQFSYKAKQIYIKLWDEYYDKNKNFYQEVIFEFISSIIEIFSNYSIELYLSYGTVLGLHRGGGIIPWDTDVDLVSFDTTNFIKLINDSIKFSELLSELEEIGFDWGIGSTHHGFWNVVPESLTKEKTRIIELPNIINDYNSQHFQDPPNSNQLRLGGEELQKYLNCSSTQLRNDNLWLPSFIRNMYPATEIFFGIEFYQLLMPFYYYEYFYNLKRVEYYGNEFLIPENTDEYLRKLYGNYYMIPQIDNMSCYKFSYYK